MTAEGRMRLAAWIFIIGGAFSVAGALMSGKLQLGTGLLAIPAGVGLLKRRAGWRTYALAVLWAAAVGIALIVVFNFRSLALDLKFFGWRAEYRSPWVVIGAILPFWALTVWQIAVLMRGEVRRLFEPA